ncbi:MAG TPA: TadE family protein [Nocardioides sp.]|nr:TadE family protein [Nocardioides sp.]
MIRLRGRRRDEPRGQALIELSMVLMVLLMLTLGTIEFGFAFDHHLTLEYATREGARTGAALSNGDGDSAVCATIDAQIVAAVQRVIQSPGSAVDAADVPEIRIFRSGADGQELGAANRWTYSAGAGPMVDGTRIDYVSAATPWPPCSRVSGPVPDSVGVSLTYTYRFQTPLSALIGFATIPMGDRTVMPLSPTDH